MGDELPAPFCLPGRISRISLQAAAAVAGPVGSCAGACGGGCGGADASTPAGVSCTWDVIHTGMEAGLSGGLEKKWFQPPRQQRLQKEWLEGRQRSASRVDRAAGHPGGAAQAGLEKIRLYDESALTPLQWHWRWAGTSTRVDGGVSCTKGRVRQGGMVWQGQAQGQGGAVAVRALGAVTAVWSVHAGADGPPVGGAARASLAGQCGRLDGRGRGA